MVEKSHAATAPEQEFIAFRIGAQEFCVDIMSVREIRGWTPATALPHAPRYVRGVINLRGAVLPIIDLSERLGLKATQATARHVIIVVHVADRVVGMLVDAVSDILSQPRDAIQPTPDVASDSVKSFIDGVLAVDGRMIGLIRLNAIMPTSEEKAA